MHIKFGWHRTVCGAHMNQREWCACGPNVPLDLAAPGTPKALPEVLHLFAVVLNPSAEVELLSA